jgi:hypothetical protein
MPILRQAISRCARLACLLTLPLTLIACGDGVQRVEMRVTAPLLPRVGVEMGVPLQAYAGGRQVEWSWRSLTNPELASRRRRPTLTIYTGGTAVWRWNPIAEDFGPQEIEFTARAGPASGAETIRFEVAEGGDPPVFREPIGEGTTIEPGKCAQVKVIIESTIALLAELSLRDPPANATITRSGDLTFDLSFCPTAAQILEERVYPLLLVANADPFVISKAYVIVVRSV